MNNNLYKKNKSISSSSNNNLHIQKDNKQAKKNKKYYDFSQGDHVKCIGPCYPKNTLFYNPLTLQSIKSKDQNLCPIDPTTLKEINGNNNMLEADTCNLNNDNFDYENYDMFEDILQIAINFDVFLKQIYDISNFQQVNHFIENNINELPILSQKRLINSIYQVYKDDDSFPTENYILVIKHILKDLYNIDAKSKKIINYIMSNKYKTNWNDLFEYLFKKLSKK
jgi:hypothetical protein